jgi:hypothetical protein
MLKNLLAIAIICSIVTTSSFAQVDVKIGPLAPIFGTLNLRSEFGLADNIGLEAVLGGSWSKINFSKSADLKYRPLRFGLNGRYYFNPSDIGLDKFYIGLYSRYASGKAVSTIDSTTIDYNTNRLAGGFMFGFKTFARNERLLFDFNLGLGRAFIYNFKPLNNAAPVNLSDIPFVNLDIPITVTVGYRF